MNDSEELVAALAPVVSILNELEIRHYVGGSVASSFHGAVRSTMDVDVVCEMSDQHVQNFVSMLSPDYYASEPTIREAIARKSCFNLIHLPTSFKVDVFVSRGRPFDAKCMQRATRETLGNELEVNVCTSEDSIIAKLEWFKIGNEASERQWTDVSKLIQLLGAQANIGQLKESAESVGVTELLMRLLSQTNR